MLKKISSKFFPTQRKSKESLTTITQQQRILGAPFHPKPASFYNVPEFLNICSEETLDSEKDLANQLRSGFTISGYKDSYMDDIVRAFRMLKGKRIYIEVGTFDRGNLAYVSSLLDDNAILIGVDIQAFEENDNLVRTKLKPGQKYFSIVGDSSLPETILMVEEILRDQKADAVFIDGDHTAYAAMNDYINFSKFVSEEGVVLFHDALWEGNSKHKGVYHALAEIDKFNPVYIVPGWGPCFRISPILFRDPVWGTVAVVRFQHG
jgi:hypothetical protein